MAKSNKFKRAKERHFESVPVFDSSAGKYSPLPWVLRRVLWLFTTREWQILTYLMARCGPEGVCFQTDREIGFDLDLGHKKVAPHVRSLAEKGFIKIADAEGTRCICVVDPMTVVSELASSGRFNAQRLQALNDDLEQMGLAPLQGPLPANVTPLPVKPSAAGR